MNICWGLEPPKPHAVCAIVPDPKVPGSILKRVKNWYPIFRFFALSQDGHISKAAVRKVVVNTVIRGVNPEVSDSGNTMIDQVYMTELIGNNIDRD